MTRVPHVRLEPRREPSRRTAIIVPIASVITAAVISAVVLLVSGKDPVSAFSDMLGAALTNRGGLSNTLASTTPLLLTGLAASFAFRMRAWNLGGEGQLYVGAMTASAVAIALGNGSLAVGLPLMIVAGAVAGAVWAAVPGLLRALANTSEIISSLMLNYVGGLLITWVIFDSYSYWRDTSPGAATFPQGKMAGTAGTWPGFTQGSLVVPLGFVIGLVLAVVLAAFFRKARFGFNMRVIADSPKVADYAGIRTKRTFVIVMMVSGALAGLAGASQVGDFSHRLDPTALQGALYGYAGIVAAALARYQPLGVIVSALVLGALTNAGYAQQGADFPTGLVGVMQGILLLCVVSGDVFTRYRIRVVPRIPSGSRPTTQPSTELLQTPAVPVEMTANLSSERGGR